MIYEYGTGRYDDTYVLSHHESWKSTRICQTAHDDYRIRLADKSYIVNVFVLLHSFIALHIIMVNNSCINIPNKQ